MYDVCVRSATRQILLRPCSAFAVGFLLAEEIVGTVIQYSGKVSIEKKGNCYSRSSRCFKRFIYFVDKDLTILYLYFYIHRNRIGCLNMNDEMAVKIYKALGEPTRLQIVKALASETHMACMHMTDEFEINSNSTLTHHLKILINAGLLSVRKEGTYRYYSLNRDILMKYAPTLIQEKVF